MNSEDSHQHRHLCNFAILLTVMQSHFVNSEEPSICEKQLHKDICASQPEPLYHGILCLIAGTII